MSKNWFINNGFFLSLLILYFIANDFGKQLLEFVLGFFYTLSIIAYGINLFIVFTKNEKIANSRKDLFNSMANKVKYLYSAPHFFLDLFFKATYTFFLFYAQLYFCAVLYFTSALMSAWFLDFLKEWKGSISDQEI